ncbi:Endonuclease/exonuclease/phosphatase [Dillenia turbinata]|uniref:Endonuclease/exonuclease/phosphatase n=1 Tax=Dillenia turbinata TaxID=194707 RepID=A0AAN8V5Z1_9MAGN
MWPKLIANKFLSKRLGSNNFVADFPTEALHDIPEDLLHQKSSITETTFTHHKDTHHHKVFVSTWNVGGSPPPEDLNIEDWLDIDDTSCDIYVLGFQEVVPLRAANVLGFENSKITMRWNSVIREALNKKNQEDMKAKTIKNCKWIFGSSNSRDFKCIISKQMVGIFISVWIRNELCPYIRHRSVSCVGCGIMACLGNKGSVSVRFQLHETRFCFVCSHLASGNREGDERYRNSNAAEILSRTTFPRGPSFDLPQKILDHDQVVLLGDLNYRISLPEAKTRLLVDKGEWNTLLEYDQLRMELMEGQVLDGWHEGIINFAPTYKYCPNSDVYYGSVEGEKRRAPAWCDRIIWYGNGMKQQEYSRGESKLSDHRPVKAIFTADVEILTKSKFYQSFFLSDSFERITSKLDMYPASCNDRPSFQV